MAEVHVGDQVYYTGDMANDAGWLKVVVTGPTNIGMVEISTDRDTCQMCEDAVGHEATALCNATRTFNVQPSNIGDQYRGHCDPRFVTKAAYDAYRAKVAAHYATFDNHEEHLEQQRTEVLENMRGVEE